MKKQDIPAAVVKAFDDYDKAIDNYNAYKSLDNKLHMINTGATYRQICRESNIDIVKCSAILLNHKA